MDLHARIERLERENRRLKLSGFVLVVLVGAGVLMAAAPKPAQVVEAREFVLKDGQGNIRGRLHTGEGGAARFQLMDGSGKSYLRTFGYKDRGGTLYLESDQTFLNMTAKGGVDVTLYTDRPRVGMSVEATKNQSQLFMDNKDGKPVYSLVAD